MRTAIVCAFLGLFGSGFTEAPYNFSGHEIKVSNHIPQGVPVVFVDHLPDRNVLGTFAQFVTIYDGGKLVVLESVVVVAVESALNHGVSLSAIISHELIHVEQRARFPSWPVFRATYTENGTTNFEQEAFTRQRELPLMAQMGKRRRPPNVAVVYY